MSVLISLQAALRGLIRSRAALHLELRKLGIEISERTVSRLLARLARPPSQAWRTFLANHLSALVSTDSSPSRR